MKCYLLTGARTLPHRNVSDSMRLPHICVKVISNRYCHFTHILIPRETYDTGYAVRNRHENPLGRGTL